MIISKYLSLISIIFEDHCQLLIFVHTYLRMRSNQIIIYSSGKTHSDKNDDCGLLALRSPDHLQSELSISVISVSEVSKLL